MPQKANANLFQYVLMAVVALLRWGAQRVWNVLTFWQNERKKPVQDRQKIDRQKAITGLLAIAAALGIVAYFVLKGMIAVYTMSAALDRQYVLYAGAALLTIGLQLVKRPNRRAIGLALILLGAALCAYGLGYL